MTTDEKNIFTEDDFDGDIDFEELEEEEFSEEESEPSEAEATAEKFDLLLGDNLAGRKDYIANFGHLYIDMTDVS